MKKDRIFISIASYRDSELIKTVISAIENSDYPELIDIWILNQIDFENDKDCVIPENIITKNISYHCIDYRESNWVCWARSYIWKNLLKKQKFALQIDSHTRFTKSWDTNLKKMWYDLKDEKWVLTHYPVRYFPKEWIFDIQYYTFFKVASFRNTWLPEIISWSLLFSDVPKQNLKTAFIAAWFIFWLAEMFKKVPYDPYIYFQGEEMTYSVRLWTNGYNFYLPTKGFVWHKYHFDYNYNQINDDNFHWKDHKSTWLEKDNLSIQRCRHLLEIEKSVDSEVIKYLENYWLGIERSLTQYENFSWVYYKKQILEEFAKKWNFDQTV